MLRSRGFVMAFSSISCLLMATMVATISGSTMKEVLVFIVTDYVCAIIVLIVLYPVIIKFLAKLQPLRFYAEDRRANNRGSLHHIFGPQHFRSRSRRHRRNWESQRISMDLPCRLAILARYEWIFIIYRTLLYLCVNLYGFAITPGRVVQFIFLGIILSVGAAG